MLKRKGEVSKVKQIKSSLILMISLVLFIAGFGSMSRNVALAADISNSSENKQEHKWAGRKMWEVTDGGIRFYDRDHYLKNEWMQDGEYWFYFDENGFMLTNAVTPDGYYVGNEGPMLTNTMLADGRVVGADGKIVQVQTENWQWVLEGETWYYRDLNSGRNWTGWLFEGGYWYWLEADGKMATGFLQLNENGKDVLYYLNDNNLDYRRWTSLDISGTKIEEKLPYGAMLSNGNMMFIGETASQIIQKYGEIIRREMGDDSWLYESSVIVNYVVLDFDENGRFIYKTADEYIDGINSVILIH